MQRSNKGFRALLLAAAASSVAMPGFAAGDVATGKLAARRWCASCHVVEPGGHGSDAVPDFPSIAADPKKTDDVLRTFLADPRHPMPNLQLSRREIEDLVAYIASLRPH